MRIKECNHILAYCLAAAARARLSIPAFPVIERVLIAAHKRHGLVIAFGHTRRFQGANHVHNLMIGHRIVLGVDEE